MERQTIESIVKAAGICSDDATRIHLQAVYVRRADHNRVSIRATDGYAATDVTLRDEYLYNLLGDETFAFERGNVDVLKLILKTYKKQPGFDANRTGDGQITIQAAGISTVVKTAQLCTLKVPDFDRIVARSATAEGQTVIAFNAQYLLDLAKAIKNGSPTPIVTLTISSAASPIHVECDGQRGILMPCRK